MQTSQYYFYSKDHLGNIRQVREADGSSTRYVIQRNDYYPFGMQFCDGSDTNNVQSRKYNGKEFDNMHGLNTYDYGARQYNPVTARWDRMDPLAEKYYSVSPYAYCMNNPIKYIDPNGKEVLDRLLTKNDQEESIKQGYIENINDNENAIILIAHGTGSGSGIHIPDDNNGIIDIAMPYNTEEFLYNNSDIWKTRFLTGNQPDLVLISCETGRPSGFAQRISADESFKDIKIYAPENIALLYSDGRCTVDEGGNWNEYINGELTNTYSGSIVPETKEFENASYWDKLGTNNMNW